MSYISKAHSNLSTTASSNQLTYDQCIQNLIFSDYKRAANLVHTARGWSLFLLSFCFIDTSWFIHAKKWNFFEKKNGSPPIKQMSYYTLLTPPPSLSRTTATFLCPELAVVEWFDCIWIEMVFLFIQLADGLSLGKHGLAYRFKTVLSRHVETTVAELI